MLDFPKHLSGNIIVALLKLKSTGVLNVWVVYDAYSCSHNVLNSGTEMISLFLPSFAGILLIVSFYYI